MVATPGVTTLPRHLLGRGWEATKRVWVVSLGQVTTTGPVGLPREVGNPVLFFSRDEGRGPEEVGIRTAIQKDSRTTGII